jgi:hypothetical protein
MDEQRLHELRLEYRKTMPDEVLRDWAADVVAAIEHHDHKED